MTKDSFFVGISNPQEVRKDLLLSSKQLVQALVAYEKYKDIREEKLGLLMELKKSMDSMIFLNKKLRSHLPRVKTTPVRVKINHEHMLESERKAQELAKATKKKKTSSKKKTTSKKKTASKPAPKSRLEQLREDLEKFDKKLSTLE